MDEKMRQQEITDLIHDLEVEKEQAVRLIALMLHHLDRLKKPTSLGVSLTMDRARAFLAKQYAGK